MTPASFRDIAIVVPTTFGYTKRSEHHVPWFIAGVLREMLANAGLAKRDVDGLVVASYRNAPDNTAAVANHLGMSPRFVVDLPYGGASGIIALRRAARAVQAGDAEVVACIGADVPPSAGDSGANFSSFWRDCVHPYGAGGFNALFSLITDSYSVENGVRREDFAAICVAQRRNAQRFEPALLKSDMTLADYLNAPAVTGVLGLYDCVMRCCGAEGVLVMTVERARRLGLPYAVMAGCVERHMGWTEDTVQRSVGLVPDDRDMLYRMAGSGPADMDFVEIYDDYPVIVMLQLESLGFCPSGEAARFIASRELTIDGDFPLNTSGGMLSAGQAGAAGSFLGLTEATRQVTGLAVNNAVVGARRGLVSCYGAVSYDRGVCWSAAVLETGRRA